MTGIIKALDGKSVDEQLDQVKAQIRKKPADADLRARLFQLLAVKGLWDKAFEQLKLSSEMNAQAQPVAVLYTGAITAEQEREAVFRGEKTPAVFEQPPEWMAMLLEALRSDAETAHALREQALEVAPAISGTIVVNAQEQGLAFEWLCDGDSRLGPVCEVIANGRYGWVPLDMIQSLRLIPPEGLTDLIWVQAEITLVSGRSQIGLIPARYPAPIDKNYADLDDASNLSRRTDWQQIGQDIYFGTGQKMWMSDAGEYALLDMRSITFHHGQLN